ncbi:MAG: N-acetylmuramoyl-L-alanine amidase [Faecalibacillus sp.]|uniref:N-acetylmuramoyl-L-alanine amidase n=1 Tax=Faecalibacillus sp. TaxID=2678891 RepID=UPI00399A28E5
MKKRLIGIIGIVIVIIIGGIFYFTREEKIELSLKNKKDIVVEYGNTVQYSFDDLIQTKDIDKDQLKEIKKETKITDNIKKEDQKDYPAIGKYTINIKYQDQKLKKKVVVKDTTPPVFNETNEVSFVEGTENYDFNQTIKATDLSNVDLQYDMSSLDINKAGDYQMKAIAKDSSGNQTEKTITVHIQAKPQLPAAKIYYGGGKIVCIDAGHQGRGNSSLEPNGPGSSTMKAKVTSGATGCVTGKTESQINLEVALKLQAALSKQGYTVVMCRTSQNVDISNAQRAKMANEAQADAFIRLHCDSSESSSPTGTLTLAPSTSNKYCASIASQSQALSKSIVNNICKVTGSRNRGVSIVDNMTGLNWSKVPVTIVEMGFLSNPGEDRLLSSEEYQNKIVQGIVNGIGEYLS